ncbi:unnamed protein product [Cylindrotheca closterium]|uniref:Uncharacterized protein n=1 Tax=Cylindrotheca closterium TaxID=2856 RepID=A0AAD2JI28_9STRA|nr:unnamed protein product [Cylindrotheca closterium]
MPTLLLRRQDRQNDSSATIQWNPNDDAGPSLAAERAAIQLLEQLSPSSTLDRRLVSALQSYLIDFYEFCEDNFDRDVQHYKARMVASRGGSGTSCPLWHIDHVPIRWIQALTGPGCELIKSEEGINWDAFGDDSADEQDVYMSAEEQNQLRVDLNVASIYQAQTSEVALLVGDRWNEFSSQQLKPVVHRSPTSIPIWERRLLLTQDVVIDSCY